MKPAGSRCRSRGAMLIEILVAVTLLSVGLLGVVALQLKGLQSAHAAFQRTLATIIARDAVERLWVGLADDGIDVGLVQADWLAHWRTADVTLPAFDGAIDRTGPAYRISVSWSERRLEDAPKTHFDYVTELPSDK